MHLQHLALHPPLLCSSFSLHQQRTGRRPLPYTTSQQQTSMATWFRWRNIGSSLVQTFPLSVCGCIPLLNSWANVSCACRGNVVIITNVASKWGKTPVNYSQFADMHARYAERGLRILAFPSNQFGNQVSNNWNHFFGVRGLWGVSCSLNNSHCCISPCVFLWRSRALNPRSNSLHSLTMPSLTCSARLMWTATVLILCGSGSKSSPMEAASWGSKLGDGGKSSVHLFFGIVMTEFSWLPIGEVTFS